MKIFGKRRERYIQAHRKDKSVPTHIAIIMDGNGRWAKKRGLPRSAGHAAGAATFRKIGDYCLQIGVKYLTVYAFSTENWKRPAQEIEALFGLLSEYIRNQRAKMLRDGIHLSFIGDYSLFPDSLRAQMRAIEEDTRNLANIHLNIAVGYGGRGEIIDAAKALAADVAAGLISPDSITEEMFAGRLYTSNMPDPDLIIRPSGELRLSNFLLWQCAYSEFWFSDVLWPDFSERDLDRAIDDFNKRNRRFGGI